MPPVVTLDDLVAMMAADPHGHRYEISPGGALSVMPPPDSEHAAIASRLLVWHHRESAFPSGGSPRASSTVDTGICSPPARERAFPCTATACAPSR